MPYGETKAPIQASPTATWGTARNITLTGQAKKILITAKTKNVYALLGVATAFTAGDAYYIAKDLNYPMYPKPGETVLGLLGSSASAAAVYVQEII